MSWVRVFLRSKLCSLSLFCPMLQGRLSFFTGKSVILHLLEGLVWGHITEERNRIKPSTRQELNPQPLCYGLCTLPLCYNCCPVYGLYLPVGHQNRKRWVKYLSHNKARWQKFKICDGNKSQFANKAKGKSRTEKETKRTGARPKYESHLQRQKNTTHAIFVTAWV